MVYTELLKEIIEKSGVEAKDIIIEDNRCRVNIYNNNKYIFDIEVVEKEGYNNIIGHWEKYNGEDVVDAYTFLMGPVHNGNKTEVNTVADMVGYIIKGKR